MYPLVNVYIAIENHHAINGKLTISMAIFNRYVTNYQRVILRFFVGVHLQKNSDVS